MRKNTIADVLDNFVPVTESGCLIWLGTTVAGYGVVSWKNKPIKVHRLMWEIHRGPIPDGLLICHKCDVPCCANHNHLFIGTYQDNTRDAVQKNRHAKMVHTHCPSGHEYTLSNTRYRTWNDGRRSKFCATCYRDEQRIYKRLYRAKLKGQNHE